MRTPRSAAAMLGGLALACAVAAPVQAQRTFPTLRVGQSVQGTLAESDPRLYERGHFKVYQFRAQPGVRYQATLQSEEFDSYLTLARTVGGITDHMMSDDDGGSEPLSSRLRFSVPEAGTYYLIAQSLGEEGTGPFTIALDTVTIRRPTPGSIRVGQTVNGQLTEDDAEYVIDQEDISGFYDLYRFQAREGQRLRIDMDFEEYIPNIAVGTMENGEFVMLEEDTGAGGTLIYTVPETGEYVLQVGAYGSVTGEYTVTMQERAQVQPRTTSIRRGQSLTGTLDAEDAELDDGRWYDAYSYTGRAGEDLQVSMASDDFDAYLIIGRIVDGEFEELDTNDDAEGEEGTDSVLEIELPDDGRYVIYATSFMEGGAGEYSLRVGSR